jgi:hypothetical protein
MTRRGIQTVGLSRIAALTAAVAGMLAACVTGAMAQSGGAAPGQWPMAGQNIYDTHFQVAEHVISPANASRLAPRWTLTTAGAVSVTPTVSGGVVLQPGHRPGPGAAVRGHREQLHRARRGLHHAGADRVYPTRRRRLPGLHPGPAARRRHGGLGRPHAERRLVDGPPAIWAGLRLRRRAEPVHHPGPSHPAPGNCSASARRAACTGR